MEYNIPSGPFSDYLTFENPLEGKVVLTKALDFAIIIIIIIIIVIKVVLTKALDFEIIIIIIIIIIITRPKLAYGQQGLAGSWGQDTDKVSNFWVFLTSLFAQLGIKPTWDHS